MPIDTSLRPRMAATVPACRAVVAARLNAPEREAALLRALRVLHFAGGLLDEPETIAAAAERLDIRRARALDRRTETEHALRADLHATRRRRPRRWRSPTSWR